MSITIYHNPKCSKSCQTLKLLQEQGINPVTIEYLKNPPTLEKLKEILSLLGVSPRDLMRKKEDEFKELGLANSKLSDEDLIHFMVKHPILIERPIVLANGKAALGRPPEQVLNMLNLKRSRLNGKSGLDKWIKRALDVNLFFWRLRWHVLWLFLTWLLFPRS